MTKRKRCKKPSILYPPFGTLTMKKRPTKAEKQYMDAVANLGCLISSRPAELHHPRFCVGMSQRASNWLVIPLAPEYHRQGSYGQCVHNGYEEFRKNYFSEEEMLTMVIQRLFSK